MDKRNMLLYNMQLWCNAHAAGTVTRLRLGGCKHDSNVDIHLGNQQDVSLMTLQLQIVELKLRTTLQAVVIQ